MRYYKHFNCLSHDQLFQVETGYEYSTDSVASVAPANAAYASGKPEVTKWVASYVWEHSYSPGQSISHFAAKVESFGALLKGRREDDPYLHFFRLSTPASGVDTSFARATKHMASYCYCRSIVQCWFKHSKLLPTKELVVKMQETAVAYEARCCLDLEFIGSDDSRISLEKDVWDFSR